MCVQSVEIIVGKAEKLCVGAAGLHVCVSLIDCGKRKFELVDMFEIIYNIVGVLCPVMFCSVLRCPSATLTR